MAPDNANIPELSATRTGQRQYVATNERGGEVTIGYGPGEFSPGQLLKLAILGCNLLSSEARFTRALGSDTELVGSVDAGYLKEEDRFTEFSVEIDTDLSALSEPERQALFTRVKKAIERYCTISHTVEQGAPTYQRVNGTEI